MRKSTIEAIIGVIASMLLIYLIAFLIADDPGEYLYGASNGFILGVVLIISLRNREKKRKQVSS